MLMRLVVDTSVLIGELLRQRGRARRLGDHRLDLFLLEQMWADTQVEPRRISAFARRRNLGAKVAIALTGLYLEAGEANVVVLDEAIYAAVEDEALADAGVRSDSWQRRVRRPCPQ